MPQGAISEQPVTVTYEHKGYVDNDEIIYGTYFSSINPEEYRGLPVSSNMQTIFRKHIEIGEVSGDLTPEQMDTLEENIFTPITLDISPSDYIDLPRDRIYVLSDFKSDQCQELVELLHGSRDIVRDIVVRRLTDKTLPLRLMPSLYLVSDFKKLEFEAMDRLINEDCIVTEMDEWNDTKKEIIQSYLKFHRRRK